jgi:type VI secretion system protein ImpH
MAGANRRASAALSERLFGEPYHFDFFQAVRLLEWVLREQAGPDPAQRPRPVGRDEPPECEAVRFRALPSLTFPGSAVADVRPPGEGAGDNGAPAPAEMTVAFFGLTGPEGVLPQHYTSLLLERIRVKDFALRDFLDLFHHRLISLFYRAWEKYRLPFAYERSALEGGGEADACTQALYCLVGLGTAGLRGRQEVDDEAFLYYAGHFAHRPRPAVVLEGVLADYFEVPVEVRQLQGQWLRLGPDDRSVMPGAQHPEGLNALLGVNALAGDRVWEVQSKFRLRVGPLTYAQFRALMPNGGALRAFCQLTRSYAGPEFDFDVQPVLRAAEVPWCRLGPGEADGPYLGWNTWARSSPFREDVADTVFALDEV